MKAPPTPASGRATLVMEHRVESNAGVFTPRTFHQENLFVSGRSQVEVVLVTEHGAMHIVLAVAPSGQVCDQGETRYMPHSADEPNEGLSSVKPKRIETSPDVPGCEQPDGLNATIDLARERLTLRYALEPETDYPGDADLPVTNIEVPLSSARTLVRWLAERLLGVSGA